MRTIRNIIFVLIFLVAIGFCLYIAPNYQKTGYEDKTNLVINFKNVTGKMKNSVILEGEDIYLSINDIKNYYDKYILFDSKYNNIVATGNGNVACFSINDGTLSINDKKQNVKVIKKDDTYYIPMNRLESVYNINIDYKKKTNTVVIDSLDRELTSGQVSRKVAVRKKPTSFSKQIETLEAGKKVYINADNSTTSDTTDETNKDINVKDVKSAIGKMNEYITKYESNESKKWTIVRTENGSIGYVKKSDIDKIKNERTKKEKESKTISLAWDYYNEKYGKAPQNAANVKYEGVNVVCPSFFYMEGSTVKESVGTAGENYIKWAKNNGYEVWGRLANNNESAEIMKTFSEWINDYKKRENVINQVVKYAKQYNIDGINLDFENMYKADKDALSRFIIELKPRLESINVLLSVDITEPDGTDNWSLCYDRHTIADVADYVIFMAYDQTSRGSKKAGSNASYEWVERNIKKLIDNHEIEPSKIIVAIPFYTRLWKVNGIGVAEESTVVSMKNQKKYISKATQNKWLEDCKQNYIEYTENGYTYKMWLEDEDSIKCKIDLVKKYNLSGVAFWQKGIELDTIWEVVKKNLF